MQSPSSFQGLGYLVSTVSVVLLGAVAWKSASQDALLLACLIGGMATSVLGMCLRWISHRLDQKQKARIEAKAESSGPADPRGRRVEPARAGRAA